MNIWPASENSRSVLNAALGFLDQWRLAASHKGILWIEPTGPTLQLYEFACLIKRLHRCYSEAPPNRILIDLSEVEIETHDWPAILALATSFARNVNAACRIVESVADDDIVSTGADKEATLDVKGGIPWRGRNKARSSKRFCIVFSRRGIDSPALA